MAGLRQAELMRRSKERVAEANERAAQALRKAEEEHHARVKLEAKIAPRKISAEQAEILSQELKGKIDPIYIRCLGGAEASQYGQQFFSILSKIGLVERDGFHAGMVKSELSMGMMGVHVHICTNDPPMALEETGRILHSDPLVLALEQAGIKISGISRGPRTSEGPIYAAHWKDGKRVLIVAEKPLARAD